ncbi:hypothetical protein EZMO1_0193 [Endozoicomonas montiporae CL-33]|uniref:Uncharacterized protein n=1 Tax=Endozoicomonas montiporae CL-33 TaxID=570277 RepID=A0A142B6T3_9GAMM|nr:hypothetical protein EZMO1_0193 [Endozoicomonas montiporae CL-33]
MSFLKFGYSGFGKRISGADENLMRSLGSNSPQLAANYSRANLIPRSLLPGSSLKMQSGCSRCHQSLKMLLNQKYIVVVWCLNQIGDAGDFHRMS